MNKLWLVFLIFVFVTKAYAKALPEWYRGVRPMAMGNAFTAIADDADAIFYNPAGLAYSKRIEARPVNVKGEISTDDLLLANDIRNMTGNITASTIEKFFGKNLYGGGNMFPSLYLPNFALGYYLGGSGHLVTRNLTLPTIDITYLFDRGIVAGFGWEMRGLFKKHFMRFGVSGKWIERQGIDTKIPISKLAAADKSYLKTLLPRSATGYGATPGFQYDIPLGRANDLLLGVAWNDIGDTTFGGISVANKPTPIRNNLAAGFAILHRLGFLSTTKDNIKFSLEMRHLNERYADPRLKAHAGFELQLEPFSFLNLAVQGGWSQDGYTAGAKIIFWAFELAAATYSVENQALVFMNRERRYIAEFTWKVDLGGKTKEFPSEKEQFRKTRPRNYY